MQELGVFRQNAPVNELVQTKLRDIDEFLRPESRKVAALLVIDMQRGFVDAGAALEVPDGRTRCLPNIVKLVGRARVDGDTSCLHEICAQEWQRETQLVPFRP